MTDHSYVRTEMLPDQPAPLGETGILRWMRDNLFSSIPNTLMTVISSIVVALLLMKFIPWAWQDSWFYESRRACLDSPDITGACWGVITDRFNQLMFGFYPREEQWRVLVAFALLVVAIAPVLFEKLPRKMIWFSIVYPFLAYWLLWGGSIWGPIGVFLGFVFMAGSMMILPRFIGTIAAAFVAVLVPVFWWMFGVGAVDTMITKSIALPRVPAQIETLQEQIPQLEAVILEKEALLPALEAPIPDLKAPIAGLSSEVDAARERLDAIELVLKMNDELAENRTHLATVEADLAALDLADFTSDDPEAALAAAKSSLEAERDLLLDKIEIGDVPAEEVQRLRNELGPAQTALYDARLAFSNASRAYSQAVIALEDAKTDVANAETNLKDARKELQGLTGLEESEVEMAALAAELERLKSELPESVAGFSSVESLDARRNALKDQLKTLERDSDEYNALKAELDSLSGENRELVETYYGLKSTFLAKQNALWRIYQKAGLVGLEPIEKSKFGGLTLSIIIGVAGIAISFPLGIILALGRQSDMFIVKTLSVGYIEFIRGVPLITLLFVASVLLNYFLPPGTNFDIILRVVIMVTLFAAAYMAEVIRGGLAALPAGQYEAADALGLDYWKSMRLIIMPQALKIAIPGIVGTFIGLFKDTTLVSIIGLLDPIGLTNAILGDADWNGSVWELYIFIALMFWVFTFGMSRYSMYLERKLQTGH